MLKVAEKPAKGNSELAQFSGFSDFHRAAMWLDEEVKRARKSVTTQVIDLTPALAEVLLERNPKNRNINALLVESFARDIEHGKWRFNGEPIIVSDDGLLNDGQHRCSAVIAADMTIQTVLIVGVARETRTTLDQGRARTVGDYLAMEGHSNVNRLGSASGLIWQHRLRGAISAGGSGKPTKSEVLAMVDEFPTIMESCTVSERKGADAYGGRSMLAFCHWTFWQVAGREPADEFIARMCDGIGLMARDPILYCRNRLIAERGRSRPNDKAELIFRTWNAWRRGETPRTLPVLGGVLPVVEK